MVKVIRFRKYFDICARLPAYDAIWAIENIKEQGKTPAQEGRR